MNNMNNYKQTLSYLFKYGKGKRVVLLSALLLVPSAIISYFFPLSKYASFFFNYFGTDYPTWGKLWLSFADLSVFAIVGLVVSLLLFIICIAIFTTVVTRHVRVGDFAFTKLLYSVNENFFPASATTVFFIVVLSVAHFVFTLFAFMWTLIRSKIAGLILSVLIFLLIATTIVYVLSVIILWLPSMSFTGQYAHKAFMSAIYKARNYEKQFFVPILISTVLLIAMSVVAQLVSSLWYVEWIINTLSLTLYLVFLNTFSLISYCDVEAVKREDLARYYFGR